MTTPQERRAALLEVNDYICQGTSKGLSRVVVKHFPTKREINLMSDLIEEHQDQKAGQPMAMECDQ